MKIAYLTAFLALSGTSLSAQAGEIDLGSWRSYDGYRVHPSEILVKVGDQLDSDTQTYPIALTLEWWEGDAYDKRESAEAKGTCLVEKGSRFDPKQRLFCEVAFNKNAEFYVTGYVTPRGCISLQRKVAGKDRPKEAWNMAEIFCQFGGE